MIPQKSEGMSFLELQNISKSYKYVNVLQDVSFSIQKGDIFGYVGPNGAGKTTTIKILVGLIQNFQGKILIKGIDISKNRQLLHKVLGYLPQETSFQEWRTVETALNTFGLLSGISKKELESRIDEVLKIVGLPDSRKRKINHLSGGMKQKLQFAQALLHDPEFIVLDEPMSGLDPTSRYQVRKIIKNLAKNGKTIFLSSHILSDIQDICTRIGILNNGNILKIGTPQELQDE
ncbi:MAG: ABC transporter ATP-binding protein, partial [Promethearchaeota archaeon]